MTKSSQLFLIACIALGLPLAFLLGQNVRLRSLSPFPLSRPSSPAVQPVKATSVSALGVLEPVGQVYLLATPLTQLGGAPRIKSITVREGAQVAANQILVRFDNFTQLLAERDRVLSNIRSKKTEISFVQSQTKRFDELVRNGAFPVAELEEKKARLAAYESQLQELNGSLRIANERLHTDTLIRAPIAGVVLRLNSRVGERPGDEAVIEMANLNTMQALVQVDESDIHLIRIGQNATIESENGAFRGSLNGQISFVGLKVSPRKRIGLDPITDPEPEQRVIDVRIRLDEDSARKTRLLTGAKIKAVIEIS